MAKVYDATEVVRKGLANGSGANATIDSPQLKQITSVYGAIVEDDGPSLHPTFYGGTVWAQPARYSDTQNGFTLTITGSVDGATLTGAKLYECGYARTWSTSDECFYQTEEATKNFVQVMSIGTNTINNEQFTSHRKCFYYTLTASNIYGDFESELYPINMKFAVTGHAKSNTAGVYACGFEHMDSDEPMRIYCTHTDSNEFRGISYRQSPYDELADFWAAWTTGAMRGSSVSSSDSVTKVANVIPLASTVTYNDFSVLRLARFSDSLAQNETVPWTYYINSDESTNEYDPLFLYSPNGAASLGSSITYKGQTRSTFTRMAGSFACLGTNKTDRNKVYMYVKTDAITSESLDTRLHITQYGYEDRYVDFYVDQTSYAMKADLVDSQGTTALTIDFMNTSFYRIDMTPVLSRMNGVDQGIYVIDGEEESTFVPNQWFVGGEQQGSYPCYGGYVHVGTPYTDLDGATCPNTFGWPPTEGDEWKKWGADSYIPSPETNNTAKKRRKTGK